MPPSVCLFLATLAAAAGFGALPARIAPAPITAAVRRCAPLVLSMGGGDGEGPQDRWSPRDDDMLAEHLAERASSARCGRPERVLSGLNSAFVLIFNAGQHDEGVYTLQGRQARAAAYVLAFERTDDADRFAQLLQAEGFDLATPLCWDTDQLSAFCDAGEFEVSLVPQGALITPPAKNEYDMEAFDRALNGGGVEEAEQVDAYASQRAAFERLFNDGLPPPRDGL